MSIADISVAPLLAVIGNCWASLFAVQDGAKPEPDNPSNDTDRKSKCKIIIIERFHPK